ncbi:MAG: helix-turn-helix transcriptional regulator [Ferruginibacter sp.]
MKITMIKAELIKKFRQLKGMKQETIAKKLSISQQAYCKMENSESIKHEKLEELLQAMNCSLNDWEQFLSFYPPPPIILHKEY